MIVLYYIGPDISIGEMNKYCARYMYDAYIEPDMDEWYNNTERGESMPVSKAQQRAVAKYMAANYDEVKIRIPKGRKVDIDAYAKLHGQSINSLMNGLIRDTLGMSEEDWKRSSDDDAGEA